LERTSQKPRSEPSRDVLGLASQEASVDGPGGLAQEAPAFGQDGLRRQGQGGPEVGQGPDGGEERGW